MATEPLNLLFPVGRLVQGDVYEAQTKDNDGQPLIVKRGPNKGQPTQRFFMAVAIRKNAGETHWAQTEWGKQIWARGHADFPGGQAQRPDFAWKIEDGDSQIPNKRNIKNADREGFPGHWIVKFSSTIAPRLVKLLDTGGTAEIVEKDAIKPGYFVQMYGSVLGNSQSDNPGVYINASIVCLIAYGDVINLNNGPDPSSVGFGAAALPPGASPVPTASMQTPAPPAAYPAPGGAPPPPTAPVTVTPHTQFLNPPGAPPPPTAPAAPPSPPAPPAGPTFTMTVKAGAFTREQYHSQGWTDDTLIANGMMVKVG